MHQICRIILTIFALWLAACQNEKQPGANGVQIEVPWPVGPTPGMRVFNVRSFDDLSEGRGQTARLLVNVRYSDQQLEGRSPKIRTLTTSRGTLIGADAPSVLMLSLYVYFDHLRDELAAWGFQSLHATPIPIGVQVFTREIRGSHSNAFYMPVPQSFLFLKDEATAVPLALNPGVVGHEYFHFLFSRLANAFPFLTPKDIGKLRADAAHAQTVNRSLFRAYHEGLADVWAWLYTEDVNTVGVSFRGLAQSRNLAREDLKLMSGVDYSLSFDHQSVLDESARELEYDFGSQIAREIYRAALQYQKKNSLSWAQMKAELAPALLRTAREYGKCFVKAQDIKKKQNPRLILALLKGQMPQLELRTEDEEFVE